MSHGDEALLEAIRRGRYEEFKAFGWAQHAPDPAALETFERCRLNSDLRLSGQHAVLYRLYQTLLELRPRLRREEGPDECIAFESRGVLLVQRQRRAWLVFSFSAEPQRLTLPMAPGAWELLVSSAEAGWEGPGASFPTRLDSKGELEVEIQPHSFACYAPPEPAKVTEK